MCGGHDPPQWSLKEAWPGFSERGGSSNSTLHHHTRNPLAARRWEKFSFYTTETKWSACHFFRVLAVNFKILITCGQSTAISCNFFCFNGSSGIICSRWGGIGILSMFCIRKSEEVMIHDAFFFEKLRLGLHRTLTIKARSEIQDFPPDVPLF